MVERWDVVVVGAGISGLATAFELTRRGRRVLVLERTGIGAEQSAGMTRIFRIAHTDPRLCTLALEARERWRAWETLLGAALLGDEGLVVTPGDEHATAMQAAGAPFERIGRAEIGARIPLLVPEHRYDAGIWDPLAGVTHVLTTLKALNATVQLRRATVEAVREDGTVVANGEPVRGDSVVVCAGLSTPTLVAPLGLDLELTWERHLRVTYAARARAACLISPDCYALPEGGSYAVGMHTPGAKPSMFLLSHGVDEIECVSLCAPWLDGRGDGFIALQADNIFALGASNAMKFGPLIGDRLARSVIAGEVHPDLSPLRAAPRP